MIGKILPTLVMTSLLLMSFGVVADAPEKTRWALIIAPTHEGGTVFEDAFDMYNYLIDAGLDDGHIIFLTDGSNAPFVDGVASEQEINDAFADLSEQVAVNDDVFIIAGDDGVFSNGDYFIIDSENEFIADHAFGALVDSIECDNMVIILSFDYSGGFIDNVEGDGRLVLSSHSSMESSETNNYNIVDGLTNDEADANEDGVVSFEEAHDWVSLGIVGQTPQKNDQIVGEYTL